MNQLPKLLHYVWVGGTPLPRRFQAYQSTWRRHNPAYELMRWDERNIDMSDPFVSRAYREKAWAKLSDYVRLKAVQKFGGIYLDTDVEVIRPLDGLLAHECFFGYQSEALGEEPVCNAVFGAAAEHPFLSEILNIFPGPEEGPLNHVGTGPELVSRLLVDRGLPTSADRTVNVDGVTVFARQVFYPYHWTEDFSRRCLTVDTLAVHHWDMSWHRSEASWLYRSVRNFVKENPVVYRSLRRPLRKLRKLVDSAKLK